jgi:hypothetical protein
MDEYVNNPEVTSEPFANAVPLDTALIPTTALSETFAVVAPAVDPMTVQMAPQTVRVTREAPTGANVETLAALLNHEESEHFRTRWNEIQGTFVDEPRTAVQQADGLVSEVVEQITRMFTNEHRSLEAQWNQGKEVSTEDLRQALQHYRTFFNRLVV